MRKLWSRNVSRREYINTLSDSRSRYLFQVPRKAAKPDPNLGLEDGCFGVSDAAAASNAHYQWNNKHNEKEHEEDFGNDCCSTGQTAETKQSSNQRDDKKY